MKKYCIFVGDSNHESNYSWRFNTNSNATCLEQVKAYYNNINDFNGISTYEIKSEQGMKEILKYSGTDLRSSTLGKRVRIVNNYKELKEIITYLDNLFSNKDNLHSIYIANVYIIHEILTSEDSDLPDWFVEKLFVRFLFGYERDCYGGDLKLVSRINDGYFSNYEHLTNAFGVRDIKNNKFVKKLLNYKTLKIDRGFYVPYLLNIISEIKDNDLKINFMEKVITKGTNYFSNPYSSRSKYDFRKTILTDENLEKLKNNIFNKTKAAPTIESYINVVSRTMYNGDFNDFMSIKANREHMIEVYMYLKNSKIKKLPMADKMIMYLSKKQIEELGTERLKESILKSSNSNRNNLVDKHINQIFLDKNEIQEIAKVDRYITYSLSTRSLPAFTTFLDNADPKLLEKYEDKIGKAIVDSMVKLGYYAYNDDVTSFYNDDNIEVLSRAFLKNLSTRKKSVIENVLRFMKKAYYKNSAYVRFMNAKSLMEYPELAIVYTETVL